MQLEYALRQINSNMSNSHSQTPSSCKRRLSVSGEGRDVHPINWRKKYAGLMPSEMKRLRQLEDENGRLKKIVADLSLDKAMLQDVLSKKL